MTDFVFNITDLPPEEQDYVLQLGKISRPFAHDPRNPLLQRTLELFYVFKAAVVYDVDPIVDVSYWNGKLDFALLTPHIKGLITRMGYGNTYVDPTAEYNVRGSEDNNIPWGGYWYMLVDKNPLTHAASFAAVWQDLGGPIYPDFDLEENRGMGKTAVANFAYKFVSKFCDIVGRSPTLTMMYTSKGFFDANVEPGIIKGLKMKLHVASWTTGSNPSIPVDWVHLAQPWIIWQYSSKGVLPGNGSSYIDLNRYYGSADQFKKDFGVYPPAPEPPPIIIPPRVKINYSGGVYMRAVPTKVNNDPLALAYNKTIWNTVGEYAIDSDGNLWYLIEKEPGNRIWIAAWLTLPA